MTHQLNVIIWLFAILFASHSWAGQAEPPPYLVKGLPRIDTVPLITLEAVEPPGELAKDAADVKPGPLRFAVPRQLSITPETAGAWKTQENGDLLWRVRLHVPGATDLNLGFTRFSLPEQARLYIVSEKHNYYEGPYTDKDNKPHGELWSPVIPGARAVVLLYVPAGLVEEVQLTIGRVNAGYRNLHGIKGKQDLSKQGSCNIDVVCPQGDPWRDEIRSVARITISGTYLCTGTLMMDAAGSFQPFFLTANHCEITSTNAGSVVAYWNFEAPTCGALTGGSLADNQTGSVLRASKADVDMSLIELDTVPDPAFSVHYAGWDRSGNTPSGSVGIHHPGGDEKAITINTDPLTIGNSCIGAGGTNSHWFMDWEQGVTESGSSGSGIWDSSGHHLVGFLSGGSSSCANPGGSDCYGRFSTAWDSGTSAASRLQDWLDAGATGVITVNGADSQAGADAFEPDDSSQEATMILSTLSQTHSIFPVGDEDWVTFTLNVPSEVILETSGASGDTRMWLYDASLNQIEFDDDDGAGLFSFVDRQCDVDELPAGTYFVKIDEFNDDDVIDNYTINLIAAPCPDSFEPDNNSAEASLIEPGAPQAHNISPIGDDDWVTFTLNVPSEVMLETSGASGDTRMWLYNASLNQIEFDDDDGAGFFSFIDRQCDVDELPAGTYFVEVDEFNDDDVIDSYTINLSVTPCADDADNDGIPDDQDSCIEVVNADQRDTDGDGYGNLCDGDLNNDGSTNTLDLNLYKQAHRTIIGDANYNVDADFNGDGQINTLDLNVYKGLHRKPPGPSCCGLF